LLTFKKLGIFPSFFDVDLILAVKDRLNQRANRIGLERDREQTESIRLIAKQTREIVKSVQLSISGLRQRVSHDNANRSIEGLYLIFCIFYTGGCI